METRMGLTRYERPIFELGGKPYVWVRVNGQLQTRPATDANGKLTALALSALAGE
ncbi:hypothetical protein SEA_UNTPL_60 [Streptomyces phage UNTPL]|jgi:hypothetical protein|nr:hypothetical protein SEA_UNTPL_60 [Streptomyces phage UNTPL]